jgi:guanylate kinase
MVKKDCKLIVLSAPSGGGKSTVARFILDNFKDVKFSISCTTRERRVGEIEGLHYYYMSKESFKEKIDNNELAEYEEIFGNYYGTLKSEIDNKVNSGNRVLFDIDVKGALSLKRIYGEDAFLIFLNPPSLEILETRLRNRATESDEQIRTRLARATSELSEINKFDLIVINNVLDDTCKEVAKWL